MDFDVVVLGSGPAGIQAAIHSARKRASTVVLGRMSSSAMSDAEISNYFGVVEASGGDLLQAGRRSAEANGARFVEENAISVEAVDGGFSIGLEGGTTIGCKALVLATGISRLKLGVPGEKELFGKGVSYCAVCDCGFYRGKTVVIVGNDSEAVVSAELMTSYASETHWVHWDLKVDDSLIERVRDKGVMIHKSKPTSIMGEDRVSSIKLEDGTSIPTDGVFIELGAKSAADIALDLGVMPEVDDTIKVREDCSAGIPGLYACGDVTGRPWQVAKAVGQGCIAGTNAADYAKGSNDRV